MVLINMIKIDNMNWNGKRTNIAKYYGKYVRIIQVINYAKYLY